MHTPYHFFLAGLMLVTGSINTITTKCGESASKNACAGRTNGEHLFDHPFVQALAMFIGEFCCLIAYHIYVAIARPAPLKAENGKSTTYNPIIFLLPALCDCTATSTMYVGLTLTYASQFQMLRGSVIIFTGLLSKFWLGRKLEGFRWMGMVLVLIGLLCVGLAAFFSGSSGASAPNPILGDILIIAAQVIVALQMVIEEKFLSKYTVPPLMAVGWEGFFGMGIITTLCLIFWEVPGTRAGGKFENINDAFLQLGNSHAIQLAIAGTIVSIAFFNFSGISVTQEMSATTRMVLDSVRTLTIWVYGMAVGWEDFQYMQVIGFFFLIMGTFVYNDLLILPALRRWGLLKPKPEEGKPLLVNDS
ncbi:uncharacterized protein MONBRDRAFT_14488 [Monosiga brevicollis MX1]|uniref:EamA domain-containing protein n=1 Tax=Monosiga brevicollis TaxID=81824 RepID=A9US20_MONBE|nr:uncharacterized protein MONBRDRAFT_14488 [Monosiga brevicollis MX1]EDQ92026.1 predicted protein [Monosiga brevicollis MX1]|eukprot:XP_001743312.1 hypothetical protein [Monosiga brevicollis MX1]